MATRNFEKYLWTSINLIAGVLIGGFFVSYFAYSEKINAFSPLLWSLGYFVIGGLLGFIFSVPKIISENPPLPPADSIGKRSLLRRKVEENTNLTQISDWLTKILIGAGLVQLKEAPGFVLKVAKFMGQGMRNGVSTLETIDSVTIMCAAIILFFLTWGFISGYIVMRLILTEQFANTDDETVA